MGQANDQLPPLLKSPEDHENIILQDNNLVREKSNTLFPNIFEIPLFFKDPAASLLQWQTKTQMAASEINERIQEHHRFLDSRQCNKTTELRIKKIIAANEKNLDTLEHVLGSLFDFTIEDLPALRSIQSRVGSTQDIFSYENALIRDWGFEGEDDQCNFDALEMIRQHIPKDVQLDTMVVLGTGASRLPSDLARIIKPGLTLACDLNPFLLLMAARILDGQSIKYFEIPNSPLNLDHSAVERTLSLKEGEKVENFKFLLTDALSYPFTNQALDLVFTPWFIDIVHTRLVDLVQNINSKIKLGGAWLNFGPLFFDHRDSAEKHTVEEVREIVESNGFVIESFDSKFLSYLHSPASSHQRIDQVHCFWAKKVKNVEPVITKVSPFPPWLLDPALPVPHFDFLQRKHGHHRLLNQILSRVDGKQSLNNIAAALSSELKLAPEQGMQIVLGVFTELFEESVAAKFKGLR